MLVPGHCLSNIPFPSLQNHPHHITCPMVIRTHHRELSSHPGWLLLWLCAATHYLSLSLPILFLPSYLPGTRAPWLCPNLLYSWNIFTPSSCVSIVPAVVIPASHTVTMASWLVLIKALTSHAPLCTLHCQFQIHLLKQNPLLLPKSWSKVYRLRVGKLGPMSQIWLTDIFAHQVHTHMPIHFHSLSLLLDLYGRCLPAPSLDQHHHS